MAWGFIVPSGQLLHSMAKSKLVPSWLGIATASTIRPAILLGCVFSYVWCVVAYMVPSFAAQLQNVAVIAACTTYFQRLLAYCILRTKFSSIDRKFSSPVGIPGAFVAGAVFALTFISVAFFQVDYGALYAWLAIMFALTAYYYFFVRYTQVLSKDEREPFFRLHVINFNVRKNTKMKRKSASSSKFGLPSVSKVASTSKRISANKESRVSAMESRGSFFTSKAVSRAGALDSPH